MREFSSRARIRLHDCFRNAIGAVQENDLFDILPEFAKVVHIVTVIPATSYSAERSFSALRRMKT